MPAIAPIAAAAGTFLAANAGAIAAGLTIVGTGLTIAGQVTGSKTLSKIGLGFTAAGGLAGLGAAATRPDVATVSGSTSKTTPLLKADAIDDTLAATTKGAKTMDQLKTFEPVGAMTDSMDKFQGASNAINATQMGNVVDQNGFLQRAGNTLKKYDTTANMLMGMGNAYLQTRHIQGQEDINKRNLGFARDEVERVQSNYSAPSQPVTVPNIKRVPGVVTTHSLLRRPRYSA